MRWAGHQNRVDRAVRIAVVGKHAMGCVDRQRLTRGCRISVARRHRRLVGHGDIDAHLVGALFGVPSDALYENESVPEKFAFAV